MTDDLQITVNGKYPIQIIIYCHASLHINISRVQGHIQKQHKSIFDTIPRQTKASSLTVTHQFFSYSSIFPDATLSMATCGAP